MGTTESGDPRKREIEISRDDAKLMIYDAFAVHRMPISPVKSASVASGISGKVGAVNLSQY